MGVHQGLILMSGDQKAVTFRILTRKKKESISHQEKEERKKNGDQQRRKQVSGSGEHKDPTESESGLEAIAPCLGGVAVNLDDGAPFCQEGWIGHKRSNQKLSCSGWGYYESLDLQLMHVGVTSRTDPRVGQINVVFSFLWYTDIHFSHPWLNPELQKCSVPTQLPQRNIWRKNMEVDTPCYLNPIFENKIITVQRV